METSLTFEKGNGQLVRIQVADIFSKVGVQHPGNKSLQHPSALAVGGSRGVKVISLTLLVAGLRGEALNA